MRVVDKIARVAAFIASEEAKSYLSKSSSINFLKNFLSFFGIFNGENTLFTKSSQKMV